MTNKDKKILVTGATGYVGGRLIPRLVEKGYSVRAMGRSVDKMSCRPWAYDSNIEIVQGDMLDRESVKNAAAGCRVIFYLVHSMIAKGDAYADSDRIAAENMVSAAADSGAEQIIYLGGLGDVNHKNISRHLLSRHEVGEILRSGPAPVTILNAAMILGSGSASFEILRYLVERLPVMLTPKWVHTPSQPIAIDNVLGYLTGCVEHKETIGQTYDIGGPDVLNYKDLIHIFTQEAGLAPRRVFPVPVLTPHLSALWIHMVTPVPSSIAVPLTEGLSVPTTCRESRIQSIIPQKLLTCRQAISLALEHTIDHQVESCWADAGEMRPPEWAYCGDAEWAGGTILECGYRARIQADMETVWKPVRRIGGETGYYSGDFLWHIRGLIDRMIGGVGLRRGRRDPEQIRTGDALDFWRVLQANPPEKLVLLAEMKLPGDALLEISILPVSKDVSELQLLSRFLPRGLWGIIYWYGLYPFHQLIFRGMLKAMAKAAGKKLISKPERFTPKLYDSCMLPPESL
jgi:uncharacterized protein YbjT (DUF2867 family)